MPIRVVTLANLINEVDLMPNCTLTMSFVVILSYILVLNLWNTKNWPYPTVDHLDAPMSTIMPMKLFTV